MTTRTTPLMFNPFDGALFASGTAVSLGLALATAGNPVLATIAGAAVTGIFVLIAKLIELWWKDRKDQRIAELERQLRDTPVVYVTHKNGAVNISGDAPACTRQPNHTGPCNGFSRITCRTL